MPPNNVHGTVSNVTLFIWLQIPNTYVVTRVGLQEKNNLNEGGEIASQISKNHIMRLASFVPSLILDIEVVNHRLFFDRLGPAAHTVSPDVKNNKYS